MTHLRGCKKKKEQKYKKVWITKGRQYDTLAEAIENSKFDEVIFIIVQ